MKNQKIEIKLQENTKSYTPIDSIIMFFAVLLVPYILGIAVYSVADVEAKKVLAYVIPQISIILSFVVLSYYRKVNIKSANQINFKLNIWTVLIVILIGVISLFGFSPIVSLLEQVASNLGYKSPATEINIPTIWSLVAKLFYIGLLPAICEEFAVRGVMTNGFKKYGTVVACTFSAFLFAFMHGNLSQFIYPLFMGFVMAFIVIKTGSIIYTIILHFFNNATNLTIMYINQKNGVVSQPIDLSNFWNIFWPILFAILAIGAIIGLLFLIKFIQKKQKEKEQLATENVSNQKQIQTEHTEQFFAKPMNLDKTITIIGLVSALIIWIFAIVQGFLG